MRIIHLSDLHLCSTKIKEDLNEIIDFGKKYFGQHFVFETANSDKIDAIENAVQTINPDIICITGDITSFGDKITFEEAVGFVQRIKKRNGTSRKVIVTPGNHDVLCSQIKALLCKKGFIPSVIKFRHFRYKQKILKLLDLETVSPNTNNPLANFNKFVADSQCSTGTEPIGKIASNNVDIWCMPFNSVSLDPLWINIGDSSYNEFRQFRKRLSHINKLPNSLIIALLHHNPISSPDVCEPRIIHAYNSFPNASIFAKEMQDDGVDIIMYGHQHTTACCQMDFIPSDPGHLYLVGAPSATDEENPGFNLFTIESRYHAILSEYKMTESGKHELVKNNDLIFESKRIAEPVTISARREIRRFKYKDADNETDAWDSMFKKGASDLLVVGPRQSQLKTVQRLDNFTDILKENTGNKVRILVTDPGLFALIKDLDSSSKDRLSQIWGKGSYSWQEQSTVATTVIRKLKEYKKNILNSTLRDRLELKYSHTLLPYGAVQRSSQDVADSILIRLLPFGVMDYLERPILRLEKRHDHAVFKFYNEYLELLWESGIDVDK